MKPLGQLPPELAAAVTNHVANGQSHAQPAEPPRDSGPIPDRLQDRLPPSRSQQDSLEKSFRHLKTDKRDRSRGSEEFPSEQRKQSTSTISERGATTPTPQLTTVDRGKPHSHATANHNSNAVSSSHRDITPRWVKPSETKLEAVKAAARGNQLTRATSPAPSSPDNTVLPQHRPHSKGFVPGSDRGSNASQYDNVPGVPEQNFEILELERPPSRMRTPRSETPFSASSHHQDSVSRGTSLAGSIVSVGSGPRMVRQPVLPQFSNNSPSGIQTSSPSKQNQFHTQNKTTEVPILHPAYSVSLDHRGQDRLYVPASRYPQPPSEAYEQRAYATTQRSRNFSPEKALMNNSFATYRRQPPPNSTHNPRIARPPPEHTLQLETQGSSTPIYLQQLTATSQVFAPIDYRFEGHKRDEENLHYLPEGRHWRAVDGLLLSPEDEQPPQSPGGMPRSPSFQQAQMSPVQEFTFPTNADGLHHYRTQYQQQQPIIRQHHPQLFGGPHYRHAQEAFAMQESMLL